MTRGATRAVVASAVAVVVGCGGEPDAGDDGTAARPLAEPSWEVVLADSGALAISVSIVDDTTVWVSGGSGMVARTVDGGATWSRPVVAGGEDLGFRDVHAFSADEAFVLSIGPGTDSRIYRTADGGASWTLAFQNEDPNAFFDCFSFWDRQRGFAFSDSHEGEFTLVRTVDGGTTWSRIDPAVVPDARPGEGAFASSGTCVVTRPGGLGWFVTGASGVDTRVVATEDYGRTWSEVVTPIASVSATSGVFSLSMSDDRSGVIVGGGLAPEDSVPVDAAVTADGGRTWTALAPTGLGGAVYGVAAVPDAPTPTFVAVSPAGSVWSVDGGASWRRIDTRDYWTVAAAGPDAVWAGGRGHVSRLRFAPSR
ncbi:MAG: hypothetical protein RH859_07665 [Longimicrobiales bacterium]